jgi:hypothetical protein
MKWGVADPAVHDDMLVSAALVAALDKVPWALEVESEVIEAPHDWPWSDEGQC